MESRRQVYRGEQLPSTPDTTPTRGFLANIVGRKKASYSVTPPPVRKATRPALLQPTDLNFRNAASCPLLPRPVRAVPCSSPSSPSSVIEHRAGKISPAPFASQEVCDNQIKVISDKGNKIPLVIVDSTKCSDIQTGSCLNSYVDNHVELRKQEDYNPDHRWSHHRRSASMSPGDCKPSESPLRSIIPKGISSLQRPLAGVDALIRASCTSMLVTEHPRFQRSSTWISPPTILQSSNPLIQNAIFPCSTASGASAYSVQVKNTSEAPSSVPVDEGSLPRLAEGKRFSLLQRSHSYTNRPPVTPNHASANDSTFNYNSSSLGRPVKQKHNLSLQENVQQYKNWLKDTPKSSKPGNFIRQSLRGIQKKKQINPPHFKSTLNSSPVSTVQHRSTVPVLSENGKDTVKLAGDDVLRALAFYQDTVVKQITDMLPGAASVVIDMVQLLNKAVDKILPDKSEELMKLQRSLHYSLADLVKWGDRILLYGPDVSNTTPVQTVVQNVTDATNNFVKMAQELSPEKRMSPDAGSGSRAEEHSNASHRRGRVPRSLPALEPSTSSLSLPSVSTQPPSPPQHPRPHSSPSGDSRSSPYRNCTLLQPISDVSSCSSTEELNHFPSPSPDTHSLPLPFRLTHSLSSDSIRHAGEDVPSSPALRGADLTDSCPGTTPHSHGLSHDIDTSYDNSLSKPPPLPAKQRPRSHARSSSSTSGSPLYNSVTQPTSRNGSLIRSEGSESVNSSTDHLSHRNSIDSGVSVARDSCDRLRSRSSQSGLDASDSGTLRLSSASATNTRSPSQTSPATSLDSFNHDQFERRCSLELDDPKMDLASSVSANCAFTESRQSVRLLSDHFPEMTPLDSCSLTYQSIQTEMRSRKSSSKVSEMSLHVENSSSITQHLYRVSTASTARSSTSSSSSTLSSASEGETNGCNVLSLSVPPQLPAKTRNASPNNALSTLQRTSNGGSINGNGYSGSNSSMLSNSSSNSSGSSGYISDVPPPLPAKARHSNVGRYVSSLCETYKPELPPKQKKQSLPNSCASQDGCPVAALRASDDSDRLKPADDPETLESPMNPAREDDRGVLEKFNAEGFIFVSPGEGDEGPSVRGGSPDALLVHACAADEDPLADDGTEFKDAFVATYRTFMSAESVIEKLLHRYNKFNGSNERLAKLATTKSFSLLLSVVQYLAITDLDVTLLETVSDFQVDLIRASEIALAKCLRIELLKKLIVRASLHLPKDALTSKNISTKQMTLIDFKAHELAEQMTVLDAELFDKVELPEVLKWSMDQSEESSPNLKKFTEHFNKMSYWVRTRILDQNDPKDREKYVMKFIKILKNLRKINNFNSYLAILSALDSAPIRRLEWQKNITDGLREYCALIDSSASFKAYRTALAEARAPCIPYIGLILQDLTFVNIGNTDFLPDGHVNFTKRWQQAKILENLLYFRKEKYTFKKNEQIIDFFNDFEDYKAEDDLWEISKQIKPRNSKRLS
ncbi:guanine nucleotide-releasing factor 2 isoform X4 [Hyalella azteca]|uniref:CRK SH3-binding GNRP n=1 Tax=Hyalella azteca TaxID=294128 RepID=A0A979FPA2_HYAAZ|nr:guanine nucleotide-releasing factor 2 isoform X4 [Hyalella azteca]